MAHTAHKNPKMMEEIRHSDDQVDADAKKTAELIRAADNVVVFTGAGISTASGIPDYRGPQGAWTLAAEGKERTERTTPMVRACPTQTHMSIVQLFRNNLLHHVISQNVDGLHRKSGIPRSNISELHGNSNEEECDKCGKIYYRDYSVTSFHSNHYTGRSCVVEGCGGKLRDTIINFGENLPEEQITTGFRVSAKPNTVHICLGTSLTVSPANDMPRESSKKGHVVIVNLQRTPLDDIATVRSHSTVDAFLSRVMHHLGLEIPRFVLRRTVTMWRNGDGEACVQGVHGDANMPHTLFNIAKFSVGDDASKLQAFGQEPFSIPCSADANVTAHCEFNRHHDEPEAAFTLEANCQAATWDIEWDLAAPAWTISRRPAANVAIPNYRPTGHRSRRLDAPAKRTVGPDLEMHGIDVSNWFAVSPIGTCDHCPDVKFKEGVVFDPKAPCVDCENVGENMMCLTCFEVHCGRHVKEHMLKHHEKTGHPLVLGLIDLSVWCYPCESYINESNRYIRPIRDVMYRAKFGEENPVPPSAANAEAANKDDVLGGKRQPQANNDDDDAAPKKDDFAATGFEVKPLSTCDHCAHVKPPAAKLTLANCAECGETAENMICLVCQETHCGRHAQGHMLSHGEATGHELVMGVRDLSVWCYKCENYVTHKEDRIWPVYCAAHEAKFGELPPGK